MTTSISSSTTAYAATGYQLVTAASYAQQVESLNNADGSSSRTAVAQGQDTAAVSKMGKMLSKLQSLADTDPDEFKQTAQTISGNLAKSAADATDPMQKQAYTDMSARFAEAAESGSMDSLEDLANGPPAPGAGSDTVSISGQAREMAAQGGSTGTGETDGDASQAGGEASGSAQVSGGQSAAKGSGGAKAGGGSSSSSDSSDEDEIDDQITELKDKIAKKESSLTEAKQQGKADSMKADEAEKLTTELADLNNQLSQLQMEKLQAQSESSSSSSSGSSGGGAAMTTHS